MGSNFVLRVLKVVLMIITLVMLATGFWGYFPPAVFFMAVCPVYLFTLLIRFERETVLPGIGLEFQLETSFVAAGLVVALSTAF